MKLQSISLYFQERHLDPFYSYVTVMTFIKTGGGIFINSDSVPTYKILQVYRLIMHNYILFMLQKITIEDDRYRIYTAIF